MSKLVTTSNPKVTLCTSTLEHVKDLYNNFRLKDQLECQRLGFQFDKALFYSFKHALIRRTALIDGRVAAMWGVVGTPLGLCGQPFLLTSPEVYKVSSFQFVKIYKKEVSAMLKIFPILENYVDAQYPEAVRLLEMTGFTIDRDNPHVTKNGDMFLKFTKSV